MTSSPQRDTLILTFFQKLFFPTSLCSLKSINWLTFTFNRLIKRSGNERTNERRDSKEGRVPTCLSNHSLSIDICNLGKGEEEAKADEENRCNSWSFAREGDKSEDIGWMLKEDAPAGWSKGWGTSKLATDLQPHGSQVLMCLCLWCWYPN